MRKWFHLAVSVALLISFSQAPLGHFHADDPDHDHGQGDAHLHWNHDEATIPSWEAEDHDADAHWIDWLAGDGNPVAKMLIVLPSRIYSVHLQAVESLRPAPAPKNLDPPWRAGLSARAPPA